VKSDRDDTVFGTETIYQTVKFRPDVQRLRDCTLGAFLFISCTKDANSNLYTNMFVKKITNTFDLLWGAGGFLFDFMFGSPPCQ